MRPPDSRTSSPPPPAAPSSDAPPTSVSHSAFVEAIAPLLALANTTPLAIFADGFRVTSDAIEFMSAAPVIGIEPVPFGDDADSQTWAWPVRITVRPF